MDITSQIINQIVGRVSDPVFLVMLIVIIWLFRMLDKRDQITDTITEGISDVKEQLSKIREVQASLVKMIEVMVYGNRRIDGE